MAYYSKTVESAHMLAYVRRYGFKENEILKQCRLETLTSGTDFSMLIMPEEAAFLSFFVSCQGYSRGLEIGVYTGYSSVALAMAMPDDGQLVCCELEQKYIDIARGYWQKAGVESKIECHQGFGTESMQKLLDNGEAESFDFAYIDADKESYDQYYELALKLVRPSGVIILDNMLWGGHILDKDDQSEATLAIKNLNEKINEDERVDSILTTIGDGTTFARKL